MSDISRLSPQERIARGMAFVPQTDNVFNRMTVLENLEMGAFLRADDFSDSIEQVYGLFPILAEKQASARGRTVRWPAPAGGRGACPDGTTERY